MHTENERDIERDERGVKKESEKDSERECAEVDDELTN